MKIEKIMLTGKILASTIIMLGIVHDTATFSPLIQDDLTCLNPGALQAVIYMSLICGTSLILSGILLLTLLKSVKKLPSTTLSLLIIGIFLFFNGILSVVCMPDNPFAWITLILNAGIFVVTLVLHQKLKSLMIT